MDRISGLNTDPPHTYRLIHTIACRRFREDWRGCTEYGGTVRVCISTGMKYDDDIQTPDTHEREASGMKAIHPMGRKKH